MELLGRHHPLFWSKVNQGSGCWPWTAAKDQDGYGVFSFYAHGQYYTKRAHRLAYQLSTGSLPEMLDHLCNNRACCNPEHLVPSNARDNTMRSEVAPAAVNSRKTACIHGHEFSVENTKITRAGKRQCRECLRVAYRRYHASKRSH